MNIADLYEVGEQTALREPQKRDLIHAAYWHGVNLAKLCGCPETRAGDNRALELAFLLGFLESRKYRQGVTQ